MKGWRKFGLAGLVAAAAAADHCHAGEGSRKRPLHRACRRQRHPGADQDGLEQQHALQKLPVTMQLAVWAIRRGDRRAFLRATGVTLVLGAIFLAGAR